MLQQSHSVFCYQRHSHVHIFASSLLSFVYVSIFIFFLIPFCRSHCFFLLHLCVLVYTQASSDTLPKKHFILTPFCAGVWRCRIIVWDAYFLLCQWCLRFFSFFYAFWGKERVGQLFFRGWMIWRDIQYFFHIIFFSYTFSSSPLLRTEYRSDWRWTQKKANEFCYRVCQDSLFELWICVISFFFFLSLLLCIINNNTAKKGRREATSERHRHTTQTERKQI